MKRIVSDGILNSIVLVMCVAGEYWYLCELFANYLSI